MGEIQSKSKESEYQIVFNDGSRFVVSETFAHQIDDVWTNDRDGLIIIGGGKKRAKDIKSIDPYKDDGFQKQSEATMQRLEAMAENSKSTTPLGQKRKEIAIQKMRENFERLKKGEKWQFHDIDGNPCTQEEAKSSIIH